MSTEEPWEWDGCCTRCYATMDWEGDAPEVPEDSICHDCAWKELERLRAALRKILATSRDNMVAAIAQDALTPMSIVESGR
jgi:hypothetical protein